MKYIKSSLIIFTLFCLETACSEFKIDEQVIDFDIELSESQSTQLNEVVFLLKDFNQSSIDNILTQRVWVNDVEIFEFNEENNGSQIKISYLKSSGDEAVRKIRASVINDQNEQGLIVSDF